MKFDYIYNINDIEFGSDVVIYGSGEVGQGLFAAIKKERKDIIVSCFMDSYKTSGAIGSVPVVNVADVHKYERCIIIIASIFFKEISDILVSFGCSSFYIYSQIDRSYDVYDDFNMIDKSKMSILKTIPSLNNDRVFYVFNIALDKDAQKRFFSCLGGNVILPAGSCFVTNLNNDLRGRLNEYDCAKYDAFCIIDIDGKLDKLAEIAKLITCDFGKEVSLFRRIPSSRNFSVIEGKKLLFLEICKNGLSSTEFILEQLFRKYENQCVHYKKQRNYGEISISYFDEYTKFAIVRNPYTRLASVYSHVMRVAPDEFFYPVFKKYFSPFNFDNFCRFIADCPDEFSDVHFMSQTAHLTLPEGLRDDFTLLRLENFADDMKSFFSALGEDIEIPHKNKSRPDKVDYIKDYYTPELIKLVNERYKDDFINFGYEFL
ncbi:sulfotransferase family 2 domain-containing protein [Maridesulfovibrio salexigens]|uniref:Sulfotransferase family protein n=1 Tax=Maridesulfovibrio salexigens (strain ATCC 14822 / DSM 2638 / NCIMB 8403 / VKM B-1763) TaxID=526222 RepID=C6C045_MARSD|nr:sulfotransferase family 2 domain-containing protein [Maridesulfovibrio salexigens]ACS80916.1 hypothetical protein Desal_2864 [Maridesulfovibrio salexigens DSM 2638]